jgi:hypothetical protein
MALAMTASMLLRCPPQEREAWTASKIGIRGEREISIMKRGKILPAAILVLALAGAGPAIAQTSDLETPSVTVEQDMVIGTVSTVSPTSLVITTENGQTMSLALGATVAKPASLKVGDEVRVEFMTDPAGVFHASSIVLESSAPGQAAGSAPPPATPYASTSEAAESGSDRLPATASPVPLVGSLGLLSLGAGFAWSTYRHRRRASRS